MKIALIRKDYFLFRGGGERYAVNLGEGLAKLGHKVHIFANKWDQPALPGITIHKVPVLPLFSSLKNLSFAYYSRKLLARENFDITHSLSQTYPQDVYRMGDGVHRHWLRIQTPQPFYRFLKTLTPRQQVILFLERKTFHPLNYRMIICNSRLCKKHAIDYFNVPEERIRVIYNGIDHSQFHPGLRNKFNSLLRNKLNISEETIVILFIASNLKRKGLSSLIKSLPLIRKEKKFIKVLVVGRGNHTLFRKMANETGVGEQLLFTGETDKIFHYYGMGDIVALPTHYDPFSNVCLEALACGIPVITTLENGAAEIINSGETGVIIADPANDEELAEGISRFLPQTVRESVREKIAASVQNFTIEENTRKTLEVYEQVLLTRKK